MDKYQKKQELIDRIIKEDNYEQKGKYEWCDVCLYKGTSGRTRYCSLSSGMRKKNCTCARAYYKKLENGGKIMLGKDLVERQKEMDEKARSLHGANTGKEPFCIFCEYLMKDGDSNYCGAAHNLRSPTCTCARAERKYLIRK